MKGVNICLNFTHICIFKFCTKLDSSKTAELNLLTSTSSPLIALFHRTRPKHHTISFHCGMKFKKREREKNPKNKYVIPL